MIGSFFYSYVSLEDFTLIGFAVLIVNLGFMKLFQSISFSCLDWRGRTWILAGFSGVVAGLKLHGLAGLAKAMWCPKSIWAACL